MSHKMVGFVFVFTLLITTVISLLVLTCMQNILLFQHTAIRQEESHQSFYQMEKLALELVQESINKRGSSCETPLDDENQVIDQLKSHLGCRLLVGHYQYRYVIERLNHDACQVIRKKNHYFSTRQHRVTLLLENTNQAGTLLQIRYIEPMRFLPCQGVLYEVKEGMSSWRYLPV